MPSVTLIIPVYKVEKYIGRCLQSVVEQTFPHIQCVVVNDCTPDNSYHIAKNFVDNYNKHHDNPHVAFLLTEHTQNKGLSEARNTGVRMAMGDYVYFLDSDDTLPPTAIADLMEVATQGGMPDVVYGDTMTIDSEEHREVYGNKETCRSMTTNKEILLGNLRGEWPRIACNKLVRRTLFTEQGFWFFSGILHEDELWTFEISTAITSMLYCPKTTYLYDIGDTNSITRSGASERHFRDNITVLERKMEYLPKVSCPEEVAQFVYQLSHQFYLSIVVNRCSRKFRKECRRRLGRLIGKALDATAGNVSTSRLSKIVWRLFR